MKNLGPSGKWTVVHAEMEALNHAAEKTPALLPTVIYTDSKQAIRNLNDRRGSNTSAARRKFGAVLVGKRIKVCWVLGHDKVVGNRRADALAERAHNGGGLHQQSITAGTPLRNLQAIYRARIKARTNGVGWCQIMTWDCVSFGTKTELTIPCCKPSINLQLLPGTLESDVLLWSVVTLVITLRLPLHITIILYQI